MGDGFATVEKKWNFVTTQYTRQRLVKVVEIANKNGAITEPVAAADEFQNFARSERGFHFGVWARNNLNGFFWILDSRFCVQIWASPTFFQMLQNGIFCKAVFF